jgi:hypothetical protein
MQEVWYGAAGVIFAYCIVSLRYHGLSELPTASLQALLAGSAATPFQYRALVTWLASLLQAIHLPVIQSPFALFATIEFTSTVLLVYAFRSYLRLCLSDCQQAMWLSLSIFFVLPFNFILPRQLIFLMPSDYRNLVLFMGLGYFLQTKWRLLSCGCIVRT